MAKDVASPGRWPIENRRYPRSPTWKKVTAKFTQFSEARGTPELLIALAMGKVESCPFEASEVNALKNGIVADLQKEGFELGRRQGDREDVPIDFRFLGLLLRAADDPEAGLGALRSRCTSGVGNEDATPTRHFTVRKTDPRAYLEEEDHEGETAWRRNCATLRPLAKEVYDVLRRPNDEEVMLNRLLEPRQAKAKIPSPCCCVARVPIGRTDQTEKSQREFFTMAPTAWQLTRRQDSGTKIVRQSPRTSNGGCARRPFARSQHLCTHGRRERGPPPGPCRPTDLAAAWLPIATRRRCAHQHSRYLRYHICVVLLLWSRRGDW